MKKLFSLLLVGALSCSMAWADVSLTAYKGSASNTEVISGTIAAATTAWNAILADYPNAVAVGLATNADNVTFSNQSGVKNIILQSTKKVWVGNRSMDVQAYNCPNLVLTDLSTYATSNGVVDYAKADATSFYAPCEKFTAANLSYSRTLRANDYNSVCVPFAIPAGTFGEDELLMYNNYKEEDNDACFIYYNNQAVNAGVAVIVKPTEAEKNWSMSFSTATDVRGWAVTGQSFHGVFATTDYTGTNTYSVNTSLVNKFSPLASNLYPFRACFKLDGSSHNTAPRLVILESSEVTALDEVANSAKVEKVLVGGQLMIRKNGQLFDINGKIVK